MLLKMMTIIGNCSGVHNQRHLSSTERILEILSGSFFVLEYKIKYLSYRHSENHLCKIVNIVQKVSGVQLELKILIIEDEIRISNLLKMYLEREKFDVEV